MILASELYLMLIPIGLVVGHIVIAVRIFKGGPRIEQAVRWLALLWVAFLTLTWALRTAAAGHIPLFGMYESALSLALATVIVAVLWEIWHQGKTVITPLAVLIAAALMSHGKSFDPTPYALTISERSWVVDIHAIVAWFAFGIFALSNFLALRIVLGRTEGDDLERPMVTSLQVGFVTLTAMIITGSIYKFMLFGTAWSFDPVESMALVVWMAYATLLHLHLFVGWKGKRLAGWTLGLFVLLTVSFRCLVYFPAWSTYHIFDMDRRIHVGPQELGFGEDSQ